MGEPARAKAAYEELLALPDNMVGEIVDGDLQATPRPAPRHAKAASTLGGDLSSAYDREIGGPRGPGGWWILDEPELHVDQDVLVPDVAGWRRDRMPELPDAPYFTLAPDWVCEVVSPATERIDRVRKKRIYARVGVVWLWIVNPIAETLEVLRRAGDLYEEVAVFSANEIASAPPFEETPLELSRWWGH